MLLLTLFSVFIIHIEEITAQYVIDNEAISNSNNHNHDSSLNDITNGDTSNLNEFTPKPIVHVSIKGTEINDKIRGGNGNNFISGEEGDDILQGNEGDDELDGRDGDDELDGGDGDDELKGGKGADLFVCDEDDKIIDYNSLENDIIQGDCEYEDKGLIPEPISEKEKNTKNIEINPPLFPNLFSSSNNDNSNANSILFGIDNNRIFP